MNSVRCQKCGLISWATMQACKRCGEPLSMNNASTVFQQSSAGVASVASQVASYDVQAYQPTPQTIGDYQALRQQSFQTEQEAHNGHNEQSAQEVIDYAEIDLDNPPAVEKPSVEADVSRQPVQQQLSDEEKEKLKKKEQYYKKLDYQSTEFAFNKNTGNARLALFMGVISLLGSLYVGTTSFTSLVSEIIDPIFYQVFLCGFAVISCIISVYALVKAKTSNSFGGDKSAIAGIVLNAIAILLLLFVTAKLVPTLIASLKEPNEVVAVKNLRGLYAAQIAYKAKKGEFALLQDLESQGLIDKQLATGKKDGYSFAIKAGKDICEIFATPIESVSENRSFYISLSDGVIHAAKKNGQPASADDPVYTDNETNPNQSQQTNTSQNPPTINKTSVGTQTNTNQSGLEQSINVATETAVMASMRMLYSSELNYQTTSGNGQFASLQQLHKAGLIDEHMARGLRNGYKFKINLSPRTCEINATPVNAKKNPRSFFLSCNDGVIHAAIKNGAPAVISDPPIGQP